MKRLILLLCPFLLFSHVEEYITTKTFERAADKSFFVTFHLKPEEIEEGDIVHTRQPLQFFLQKYPQINCHYILLSHRNTRSIEKGYAHFLDDEKLTAWFAQNIEISHPKLHLIPLGIYNEGGRVEILDACRKKSLQCPKRHLLYMNFSIDTFSKERGPVYALFKDAPYCYTSPPKPYEEYLMDLAASQFVLSPRGMGLDCFRTWESLYMGAIPIVKSSPLDLLFENLPVLIVQDWEEISEEFLMQKYEEMQRRSYQMEKLTSQYWVDWIRSFKNPP